MRSAIYAVYGREFSNSLIEVDYELEGIRVQGFISQPQNARPNRNLQTFFVNGRFVKSRTAGAAVDEAAKGSVMVGKFLSCVLNISMSFNAVDVNVHPAKIEVRFVNERPLFNAVYHAVKSALIKGDTRKQAILNTPANSYKADPFAQFDYRSKKDVKESATVKINTPIQNKPVNTDATSYIPDVTRTTFQQKNKLTPIVHQHLSVADPKKIDDCFKALDIIKEEAEDAPVISVPDIIKIDEKDTKVPEPLTNPTINKEHEVSASDNSSVTKNKILETVIDLPTTNELPADSEEITLISKESEVPDFKFIGEAFRTYIIIEIDKELILIDKHALHERMIYEELKRDAQNFSQLLLVPMTVVLDKAVYTTAVENLQMFKDCGFDVEDFGFPTLLIRSAPQYIAGEDVEDTIIEMAGYIAQNKRDIHTDKMDWIYHNIACRAAVKAGNKTSEPELRSLAEKMLSDDSLRYCPHGRPVCIVLKKSEIEKQFGRM